MWIYLYFLGYHYFFNKKLKGNFLYFSQLSSINSKYQNTVNNIFQDFHMITSKRLPVELKK